MRDFFVIFIALAYIAIVIVLFRTPVTMKHETGSTAKADVDGMYVPRVYEVLYVKRDPKDRDVWMFAKQNNGTTSRFVDEVKTNMVNHALIYGRLYETKYVMEDGSFYYIKLSDKCSTSLGFFNCTTSVPTSDMKATILHVLGYYFA
jgi:hypothetical protein